MTDRTTDNAHTVLQARQLAEQFADQAGVGTWAVVAWTRRIEEFAESASARVTALEAEREGQYDQAVEATRRALVAEATITRLRNALQQITNCTGAQYPDVFDCVDKMYEIATAALAASSEAEP